MPACIVVSHTFFPTQIHLLGGAAARIEDVGATERASERAEICFKILTISHKKRGVHDGFQEERGRARQKSAKNAQKQLSEGSTVATPADFYQPPLSLIGNFQMIDHAALCPKAAP